MTATALRPTGATSPPAVDKDGEGPTCEHGGCMSGEPTTAAQLFPGGPLRPASWGGAGAGLAVLDGPPCPKGLDHCCRRCGCLGE
jgi:hypothetical protein